MNSADFMPVTTISKDNLVCTMQEYLGGVLSEEGRQIDLMQNPQMVAAYHSFAFDYVYGPEST